MLVALTGWLRLDPIIAFLVGLNIIWTGYHLISQSVDGLMDRAFPTEDADAVVATLQEFATSEVHFHGVRTREAGHQRFISMHMLVPGEWSVQRGHDLAEQVEARLGERFEHVDVDVHIEPSEDPRSFEAGLVGLQVPPTS
jgi:divalent metal cation (Fe/Co/Zn/Cd) transporter